MSYHARNSSALLLCSGFLIVVGASKGIVVITVLLGVIILALVGLVFAVIALARAGLPPVFSCYWAGWWPCLACWWVD